MKNSYFLELSSFGLAFLILGCASTSTRSDHLVFDEGVTISPLFPSENVGTQPIVWTKKLDGHLADLTVAKDGKSMLVSTFPNPDEETSQDEKTAEDIRHYGLSKWNTTGQLAWHTPLKSQQKNQDLSEDGSFAIISDYNNQLTAYGSSGKPLWSVEATCKPQIINSSKKILCLHDDDVHAGVVFDVYDWTGKHELTFPATDDLISARLSEDEKNLAIGLSGGQVALINENFQSKWQKEVPGKIVDISLSSGEHPKVAALYWPKETTEKETPEGQPRPAYHQRIAIFDEKGTLLKTISLQRDSLQIQLSPDGKSVFYYSNGKFGQSLGGYDLKNNSPFDSWLHVEQNSSDYSTSINVTPSLVIVGVEHFKSENRKSHVLGFDYAGTLKWDLPLNSDAGSYIYLHRVAASTGTLAVATDDSRVSVFQINKIGQSSAPIEQNNEEKENPSENQSE